MPTSFSDTNSDTKLLVVVVVVIALVGKALQRLRGIQADP